MEWGLIAFIKIMIVNIMLSGDNAIVIAMASKQLPPSKRKLAIFWGVFAAVALRIVLTFIAIQLLQIPFLMTVAALLLVWIAVKLLTDPHEAPTIHNSGHVHKVVMTIMVADFVMSMDNVIAVTVIAEGNIVLIITGILLSIPIIIWGSEWVMHVMERYPLVMYVGAGILGYTAGEMIIADEFLQPYMTHVLQVVAAPMSVVDSSVLLMLIPFLMTHLVIGIGWVVKKRKT